MKGYLKKHLLIKEVKKLDKRIRILDANFEFNWSKLQNFGIKNSDADVFAFLNIQTTSFGLKLHMLSTSWGFIIMSTHLGLHLNTLINKINKKMKNSTFEYIYYLVFLLLLVYGIYSFIKLNFISDMFLLNPFKVYDFDESPFIFYLHVISSSLFISLTIYLLNKINKNNIKERGN